MWTNVWLDSAARILWGWASLGDDNNLLVIDSKKAWNVALHPQRIDSVNNQCPFIFKASVDDIFIYASWDLQQKNMVPGLLSFEHTEMANVWDLSYQFIMACYTLEKKKTLDNTARSYHLPATSPHFNLTVTFQNRSY